MKLNGEEFLFRQPFLVQLLSKCASILTRKLNKHLTFICWQKVNPPLLLLFEFNTNSICMSVSFPVMFLQVLDDCIFAFFAVEMVIKMVALGIFGHNCYLGDKWNQLDFVIVMAGFVSRRAFCSFPQTTPVLPSPFALNKHEDKHKSSLTHALTGFCLSIAHMNVVHMCALLNAFIQPVSPQCPMSKQSVFYVAHTVAVLYSLECCLQNIYWKMWHLSESLYLQGDMWWQVRNWTNWK